VRIKKKRKKQKWDWLLDLFDIFELLGQVLWWMIRGVFHLIAKLFD